MKKIFALFLSILSLFSILNFNNSKLAKAEEQVEVSAPSAVLIEPYSKRLIYAKNERERLYPASMTKMMGLYLILEAIEEGKISFEDEVTASSYASSMGGTQIFLEENEKMKLEDLFKAVAINSANDAIVALGEHLAGNNESFIKMMNKKAKEFKMEGTNFVNATGFDDDNHYTTALDMAILGSELVKFEDKILRYTSMQEGYVRESSEKPFWLVNTNKLLKYYQGMDGLKTGYTTKAGYNLTATAKRNGVRLISVVMNEVDIKTRSKDTTALLNYGFANFKALEIYRANQCITTFTFHNSMDKKVELVSNQDVVIIVDKAITLKDISMNVYLYKIDPPISKEESVGELVIKVKDNEYRFEVFANEDVKKPSFLDYLKKIFLQLLS